LAAFSALAGTARDRSGREAIVRRVAADVRVVQRHEPRPLPQLQPRLLTSCSSTCNCLTRTALPLRPRSSPPRDLQSSSFRHGKQTPTDDEWFRAELAVSSLSRSCPPPLRCGARVTSADPVAATQPTRDLMRDLVIVAPLVVAAGLAVGALGIQAHVSETRIATDMGVAWALAAAALVTLGRPRRRRATWLLAAAAFALLGADLEWADTHAWWTLGLVFEQLWIAVLAVFDAHSGIGSAWGHGHRRWSRGSPNRHWIRTSRPARSTGCARRDARDRQPADTRDNGPRRAPMRVVIADDAPLIREGCHTSAHRKCHRSSRPGRRRRRAARMCPRTSPGRRAR